MNVRKRRNAQNIDAMGLVTLVAIAVGLFAFGIYLELPPPIPTDLPS